MQAQIAQEQLIASTQQCRELEWEMKHVREHTHQLEQVHQSALTAAQEKLATAESAKHQAEQDAASLKNNTSRVRADAAQLAQELEKSRVSLCFTYSRHD